MRGTEPNSLGESNACPREEPSSFSVRYYLVCLTVLTSKLNFNISYATSMISLLRIHHERRATFLLVFTLQTDDLQNEQ